MSVQELPEAAINVDAGIIERKEGEKELKRSVAVWGEGDRVLITLTNQRLLIRTVATPDKNKPRELKLSDVTKAKIPSDGFFGNRKDQNTNKIHIKTHEDVKYEIVFSQPGVSIMTEAEERDDFLKLMQENLGDTPPGTPTEEDSP